MFGNFVDLVSRQTKKRLSVLSTAANMTVRPTATAAAKAAAHDMTAQSAGALNKAFEFFLSCVAIILVIEAVFSFAFNTAFSDLVHHFYPVLVAALCVLTIYLFLKLSMTKNINFAQIATSTLYVGGTALLVVITSIFVILTMDFLTNYQSVMTSSCKHRTIMCLLSGNSQSEYGVLLKGQSPETQGWSFSYILLLIMGATLYYSHVLSSVLKAASGVSRWRTYLSLLLSFVLLAPACLILINTIYRLIYT